MELRVTNTDLERGNQIIISRIPEENLIRFVEAVMTALSVVEEMLQSDESTDQEESTV